MASTKLKPIVKTTPHLEGTFSKLKEACEDPEIFRLVSEVEEYYAELRRSHEMALLRLEGSLADGNTEFIKKMALKTLSEVERQGLPNFS